MKCTKWSKSDLTFYEMVGSGVLPWDLRMKEEQCWSATSVNSSMFSLPVQSLFRRIKWELPLLCTPTAWGANPSGQVTPEDGRVPSRWLTFSCPSGLALGVETFHRNNMMGTSTSSI